ncbi:fibrinogen alpha chain [Cebidichthys violaceus]|uniref:fibrinogen alpha chain n=1 Tax=Cebidichthys violaceus TaxID=271503 RepID=UPI0035C9C25E
MADSPPVTARHTGSNAVERRRAFLCVRTTTGLQGLISQTDSKVERKLRKACKAAKMYEDAAEKSMTAMTHIYSHNRRIIVNRYTSELRLVEHAEGLRSNLTSLRRRSSRLSLQLEELSTDVQRQMEDMYRTEVDIDMKLRACSGSCRLVLPLSVDHLSYQTLRADVDQVDETLSRRRKAAPPPKDIPRMKLQPVDVGPAPSPEYRTIPTVRRELLTQFEDIGQNRVVVEELLEALHPAELRQV